MSSEKQQEIRKNYLRINKSSVALKKNLLRRKKVNKPISEKIKTEL